MKTITYRGEQYEVEDWVNFVAMDASGEIYAYEIEPGRELGDTEWSYELGRVEWIGREPVEWEESLEKV